MKWLLWKDYRNNRVVVIAALVFLLMPHLTALYAGCVHTFRWHFDPIRWIDNLTYSSVYSLILSQLAIALIGGNAIAGERADRSAEFLASLPISRKKILASKLLLSLAIIAVIWATDVSVLLCLARWSPMFWRYPNDLVGLLGGTAIVASAFFSIAWFLSSFLASPTFAVAGGLLTPLLLWTGIYFGAYLFQLEDSHWFQDFGPYLFFGICLTLAPICFVVGTWHYLRRVEP